MLDYKLGSDLDCLMESDWDMLSSVVSPLQDKLLTNELVCMGRLLLYTLLYLSVPFASQVLVTINCPSSLF